MYIISEWEQRKNGLYRKSRLTPKGGGKGSEYRKYDTID
jgi:hypothetical protein